MFLHRSPTRVANFSVSFRHAVSWLPLNLINRLEMAALQKLKFNLSVDPRAWHSWLVEIRNQHTSKEQYCETLDIFHILVSEAMDDNLIDIQVQTTNATVPFFWKPSSPQNDFTMCEFQANDHVYPDSTPPDSPDYEDWTLAGGCPTPASWYPEADPIIPKAPRQIGSAPGASNFAEDIVNNILDLRGYTNDSWAKGWQQGCEDR
jgi:hypothetical protein